MRSYLELPTKSAVDKHVMERILEVYQEPKQQKSRIRLKPYNYKIGKRPLNPNNTAKLYKTLL